jgi:uncharacterized membrane protein
MPEWILTASYWLHMGATVVWIGGLFFQAVILAPALRASSFDDQGLRLLEAVRRRFEPLAWLSLAILIATGLTQMSASPFYDGFLKIDSRWATSILLKHLTIGLMLLAAGYQTWVLQPRLGRLAILQAKGAAPAGVGQQLGKRIARLHQFNLALGLLVLALTALARTA